MTPANRSPHIEICDTEPFDDLGLGFGLGKGKVMHSIICDLVQLCMSHILHNQVWGTQTTR